MLNTTSKMSQEKAVYVNETYIQVLRLSHLW